MCGFDRSTITVFGRELRQQNVQCLDLTDQRLVFWQRVAATKCSTSGFDKSTIRVLGGSCVNKMFNVWI